MVQRINFIEKGAFALTYKNMLLFAGALCLVCVVIHGGFMLQNGWVKNKAAEIKKQVQELTVQKDKALAAMQIAQSQAIVTAAPLASLFVKVPIWSTTLGEIGQKMPKQIWLSTIRSTDIGDRTDIKKIEIAGKSASHAAVAQFVGAIDSLDKFQNTVLVTSKKDTVGYSFLINTEVLFPESEW